MIFLRFWRKDCLIICFFAQTAARFCKKTNGFFRKTPYLFAENCQKSQKIVIIPSTTDKNLIKKLQIKNG
jgi:hypothetical protein